MVDFAYVVETMDDTVFIVADDLAWHADMADSEGRCESTRDTLPSHGTTRIELSVVPARTAPEAEPGAPADGEGTTAFPHS